MSSTALQREAARPRPHSPMASSVTLSVLTAVYALARILQVQPGKTPMIAVVALHVLPLALFALIHGAAFFQLRGILIFIALCLFIGNLFENLGVRTGIPFGSYYFTSLMGPRIFSVPILLGIAYVGMGYLSWTLARLILGHIYRPLTGGQVVSLPILASFLMVAWDFSQDPIWATILRAWVWRSGGPYFGVPLSNFFGWYLTVYVIFQVFAFYLRDRSLNRAPLPSSYWRLPVILYAISAAGNVLLTIGRPELSVVSDPTGRLWRVSDITGTCALVSIFTMGAFATLAWIRLPDRNQSLEP